MTIHAKNQKYHFKQRMLERYSIDVTDKHISSIIHQITTGTSKLIHKRSRTTSLHEVTLDDLIIRVVYSKTNKTLITVQSPKDIICTPTK